MTDTEKSRILRPGMLARLLVSAAVILLCLAFLQKLLMPKYMTDYIEGSLIAAYYGEEKDHDVVFIGDCEVYENFSPKILWEEFGINSTIRGSAQQLIWQSYYLLEDTLRYEVPEVIIFNVLAMQYNEPQREAYNRMTLDGMAWSPAKIRSILASMTEEEHFLDYIFPLLRYHSRWSELKTEDLTYLFKSESVSHNGYLMRVDVRGAESVPEGRVLPDYRFGENAWTYLDKMTELCKEKGIELILIKAPSLYPTWYDQWDEQIVSYAEEHGLTYINFLNLIDEAGLDFSTDTYDAGLHLNIEGAEKISRCLGKILREQIDLEDRRSDEHLSALWLEKIAAYEREMEEQYAAMNADR